MNAEIASKLDLIKDLCVRHGVASLELFGSATRDDFNPVTSDFDFLVEFQITDPGTDYGYRYLDFADELEALVERQISIVTVSAIKNPYFRAEIDSSRQELFRAENALIFAS